MNKKIAVIALGNSNSGKSSTWYELFGRKVYSGRKKLLLNELSEIEVFLQNTSFEENGKRIGVDVFLKNSSFEECGEDIANNALANELPNIIFCSVQYVGGIDTINWFLNQNYYLYVQWLNPGFNDKEKYEDSLNYESLVTKSGEFYRTSGEEIKTRAEAIRKFLVSYLTKNK